MNVGKMFNINEEVSALDQEIYDYFMTKIIDDPDMWGCIEFQDENKKKWYFIEEYEIYNIIVKENMKMNVFLCHKNRFDIDLIIKVSEGDNEIVSSYKIPKKDYDIISKFVEDKIRKAVFDKFKKSHSSDYCI